MLETYFILYFNFLGRMADQQPKKKQKRSATTGFSSKTNERKVRNFERHKTKGDWRRFGTVNVQVITAYVKWEKEVANSDDESGVKTFVTQIPDGMRDVLEKMKFQQNRTFNQSPLAVKDHFSLTEQNYNPKDFQVSVSFAAEAKFEKFWYAYCHICSNKKSLKKTFWDGCEEGKLPTDVSIGNLMENWDKLGLSWNSLEYVGCLLPNEEEQTLMINAKMILRPEKHWNSVHEVQKKKTNPQKQQQLLFARSDTDNEVVCTSDTTTERSTAQKRNLPQPKLTQAKKLKQTSVSTLLDPKISFVGYSPNSMMEKFAFGFALNNIHVGVNANISNETILKFQNNDVNKLREFCEFFWPDDNKPNPPRVALNNHNIHDGINAIVEAYRTINNDSDNPYRELEKSDQYSLIYDGTSYFLKNINTTMVRVVRGDGTIVKIPYNLKQVPGSFTGEVLM